MPKLHPFQNEAEVILLGELSIENRTDRITIHGNLDITRDRAGLADAKALKAYVDLIVRAMEGEADLPEKIAPPKEGETVKNPFA
jgi:hypothetical protein